MKVYLKDIRTKEEALRAVEKVGVDSTIASELADKIRFCVLEIGNLSSPEATILKQVAISRGTDAAVHREVIVNGVDKSTVLLPGSFRELKLIAEELKKQPFGLPSLGDKILNRLEIEDRKRDFKIMGVLNITPDSFSDGGEYGRGEDARKRFNEIVEFGADIIDVGAESSRPGAKSVGADEELERLLPVLSLFGSCTIPVSIDTYKSEVAREALSAGASVVNDISALRMDPEMVEVVRDFDARVILMHMRGTPETMQENPSYDDVIGEIREFFLERVEFCLGHHISPDRIILDPGIGFGKRQVDNLVILNHLREFTTLGFPVLVGVSRKSFIGNITGKPPGNRLAGSLTAAVYSYIRGASILRVHDVLKTREALAVISHLESEE